MKNEELIELLKLEKNILLLDGKNLEEIANMTANAKSSFFSLIVTYLKYKNNIINGNYKIEKDNKIEIIKTDIASYNDIKRIIFDLAYINVSNTAHKTYNLRYVYKTNIDMINSLFPKEYLSYPYKTILKEDYKSTIYIPEIGWIQRPSKIKVKRYDYNKRLQKIMETK